MTHEELDKATADEAWRIMEEGQDVAVIAARLARERAQAVSDALVEALDDYGNWDYWDKELRQIIDNYKAAR